MDSELEGNKMPNPAKNQSSFPARLSSNHLYRHWINRIKRPAWLGTLRRLTPLSEQYGYDRGQPIDRYYIESFLRAHQAFIYGHTLEIKDSSYTKQFGKQVAISDVLDIDPSNPNAAIIADLAAADKIPSDTYDCFILTQTLQYIYDLRSAIRHAHRILKPGGALLATVPTVSRINSGDGLSNDFWRFTTASCSALFGNEFGKGQVQVQSFGNILTEIAFLTGMAGEEFRQSELNTHDDYFPLIIAVLALKSKDD
jgi:SAM-dependent methyltransferase